MSSIKERPIMFSAPMVRAILEGRKTVTRRMVKDWQSPSEDVRESDPDMRWSAIAQMHPRWGFCVFGATAEECAQDLATAGVCPYGRRRERLWVRETWAADAQLDAVAPSELSMGEPILYAADGALRTSSCSMISPGRRRPSIHMPRWMSRILLEISDIRVERLQEISEEQAETEGVGFLRAAPDFDETLTAKQLFEILWDHINGEGAWAANPWVWVIEFKRVTA